MAPEVLLDAFTIIAALQVPDFNRFESMERFLEQYADRRKDRESIPNLLKSIALDDLKRISATHSRGKAVTKSFCHLTLSKHPITGMDVVLTPLSKNEEIRIYRALYRRHLLAKAIPPWHGPFDKQNQIWDRAIAGEYERIDRFLMPAFRTGSMRRSIVLEIIYFNSTTQYSKTVRRSCTLC
jgi:hypothetical protein